MYTYTYESTLALWRALCQVFDIKRMASVEACGILMVESDLCWRKRVKWMADSCVRCVCNGRVLLDGSGVVCELQSEQKRARELGCRVSGQRRSVNILKTANIEKQFRCFAVWCAKYTLHYTN